MSRNSAAAPAVDSSARRRPRLGRAAVVGVLVVGALLALGLDAPTARAASCADEATELRTHLEREAHRARRWNTAWAIGFGSAVVVQASLAMLELDPFGAFDRDYEETLYVGAAKATLGTAARLVLPLRVRVPAPAADPCADRAALRDALTDAARRERRTFWLTQLGGLAVNLTGMALLTHRRSFAVGATSFVIALPVAPASAFTQPRGSWRRWRDVAPTWSLGVAPTSGGAMLWLML